MSFVTAGTRPPQAAEAASSWRDVYLAAGAKAISAGGDFLAATALVLTLQSAGASGYQISALLLASALPLALLAPLAGRLVDRVDSRTLLVSVGSGQAVICAALALTSHPVAIIVLVALLASGLAITQPALSALIPAMVRREDLPRAGAVSQTAGTLGMLIGPGLAGLLVGQFGARIPLLLDAVSFLALVVVGFLLRTRRGGRPVAGPAGAAGSSGEPVASGPGWSLWHDPLLRAMVLSVAAVVGAVGAVNVVEVFFVRETLDASTTMYGLIEMTWTVGTLLGAWLWARLARRARDDADLVRGVLVLLGVLCLTLPAAAMVGAVVWLLPLWAIGGALNGGMNVYIGVVVANRVPAERRGQAFAALGGTIQGVGMAGYLAGGFLLEHLPIRPLVAGLGVAGLIVVAAMTPGVARVTRRERSGSLPGRLPARPAAAPDTVGP